MSKNSISFDGWIASTQNGERNRFTQGDPQGLDPVLQPLLDGMQGRKHLSILLTLCSVLGDDSNDPFFRVGYANMFPIALRIIPPDYQLVNGPV